MTHNIYDYPLCRCKGTGLCGACSAGLHACSCGIGLDKEHGVCWDCKGTGRKAPEGIVLGQTLLAHMLREGEISHELRQHAHAAACESPTITTFYGCLITLLYAKRVGWREPA